MALIMVILDQCRCRLAHLTKFEEDLTPLSMKAPIIRLAANRTQRNCSWLVRRSASSRNKLRVPSKTFVFLRRA